MRRGVLLLALLLAAAASWIVRSRWSKEQEPQHNPRDVARVEPSPVCPWRNPARDLAELFPPATNYLLEARIVSGLTAPIQKKLGRLMHPDENPLRIHRVRHQDQTVGSVLVTRVKAEHGGIEIVTGVKTNGTVRGVLIQSQREPPASASAITNASWLAGFAGKSAASALRPGVDLPDVPEEARLSAQAIADGVRDLLIVLSFAEMAGNPGEPVPTPHH